MVAAVPAGARRSRPNVRVAAAASTRLRGLSTRRPRRRPRFIRDVSARRKDAVSALRASSSRSVAACVSPKFAQSRSWPKRAAAAASRRPSNSANCRSARARSPSSERSRARKRQVWIENAAPHAADAAWPTRRSAMARRRAGDPDGLSRGRLTDGAARTTQTSRGRSPTARTQTWRGARMMRLEHLATAERRSVASGAPFLRVERPMPLAVARRVASASSAGLKLRRQASSR